MSDKSTIEQKLVKLASVEMVGPARKLGDDTGSGRMAAILSEIDNIVLPRLLVIETPSGGALRCEIANRRLLSIASDGGPPPPQLDADLEGVAQAVADYIITVLSENGQAIGRVLPLAREVGPMDVGTAARALAVAWGIALEPGAADDPYVVVGQFLENHAGQIAAWYIHQYGAEEAAGGDDPAAVFGDKSPQVVLSAIDSPAIAAPGEPVLVVTSPTDDSETALLLGRLGTLSFAIRAPKPEATTLLDDWQRLTTA